MQNLNELSKEIRRDILSLKFRTKEEHIGSALSCADILNVLYFEILNLKPENPTWPERDRFVLSKGHAASALYVVLQKKGFFEKNILDDYCRNGSKIAGHSTLGALPGIEATAGSLGHGLPMASGMALAGKRDKKDYRVFVLISDGECDEGTTWESLLFASHQKLDNLVVIVDYNKWQAFGRTNEVLNLEPLAEKFKAFGCAVKEASGHDLLELEKLFSKLPFESGKPSVLICHTIKGKGVAMLEDKLESHYVHLEKDEYEKSIKDLS